MRCGERGSLNECRNTTIVAIMVWFSAQHLGMLPPNSHPTVVHCTEVETSSEIATCSLIVRPKCSKAALILQKDLQDILHACE